jgi:uncharacterized membrane protein YphA (DoxX/SURF4 family)
MYERAGYRTLLGRIRNNARLYIRKQLELPRQEIAEIINANLGAVKWFGIALGFGLATLIAFTVLVIALVAALLQALGVWAMTVAALIVFVWFIGMAALTGYRGYKKLELRGPTRSIESFKETVRWAKSRLLGRTAS